MLNNVAQAAPADRVVSTPMMGMCLVAGNFNGDQSEQDLVPCFRAYLLVTGTKRTEMKPLLPGIQDLENQQYNLISKNVKCLLSNGSTENLDLQCYCDWASSLNYRLDKDTAIARISDLKQSDEGRWVASVEHIDKISKPELDAVRQAMSVEWKTALTRTGSESVDSYMSPERADFFENPPHKVRRVASEPQSPAKS